MDIKLTIGITPELKEVAESLISVLGKSAAATPTKAKAVKATPTEAVEPIAPLQEQPKATEVSPIPEPPTKVEQPVAGSKITVEALRLLVQQKATSGKKAEVKALLTGHDAASVTALAPEKYEVFYNEVNAL